MTNNQKTIQQLFHLAGYKLAKIVVRENRKRGYISAIKLTREITGFGLLEARNRVQEILNDVGEEKNTRAL